MALPLRPRRKRLPLPKARSPPSKRVTHKKTFMMDSRPQDGRDDPEKVRVTVLSAQGQIGDEGKRIMRCTYFDDSLDYRRDPQGLV